MDKLDEMLLKIGELFKQREKELQERISELERRVEALEERGADMIFVDELGQVESDREEIQENSEPEVEIEIDFGEEDDDWADEYEEGDVAEEVAAEVIEEMDGTVQGCEGPEEVAEDGAVGLAEDGIEEDEVAEQAHGEVGEFDELVEIEDEEYFLEEDTEDTVGNIVYEHQQERVLVVDKARPEWYDWEVDIPGAFIDDIWDGIGLNDRMLFLRELFDGNEEGFRETVAALNNMERLAQVTEFIRERYPQWDEESDEVYRFYMTVRRRFNKQKQEG